jgi:protein phosphatase PTC2/3
VIYGPHRVFPGRLSVSRTFGDIEAKLAKLEGNPKVVIAEPDITAFKITDKCKYDFIIIGCDGIFDKMDNKETVHLVWQNVLEKQKDHNKKHGDDAYLDVHQQCGMAVDCLLKTTALRKGCDNLTVVMIAFEHFEQYVQAHQSYKVKEETIVEVLLPPLLEANDQLNYLNDVEESLKRVYMEQQRVLYLESDEALDEDVQPAFV